MTTSLTVEVSAQVPATIYNTPTTTVDVGFWQEIINWIMNWI